MNTPTDTGVPTNETVSGPTFDRRTAVAQATGGLLPYSRLPPRNLRHAQFRRFLRTHLALGAALLSAGLGLLLFAMLVPGRIDWGTTSFVVVVLLGMAGVVLVGGRFVSAMDLALVACLSALATAGRVLFASLPNFKPVTFIVLASGAALGPGRGFLVGATTALVSNLFFGQGPWTPWQTVGWGAVGAVGGLLGRRGRVPGRLELALVGGALSLLFDWFVSVWMYIAFTTHSWEALLALYARGLPFDIAHVTATVMFSLLFGAQTIRILGRFRSRTQATFLEVEETHT
jgi:energy-coupling factor transport system substrate-specific component